MTFSSCFFGQRAPRWDVILSDLGLPDIPGDGLIHQILARAKGRHTITGYGEPHVSRARQAGAEVVFTKPVERKRISRIAPEATSGRLSLKRASPRAPFPRIIPRCAIMGAATFWKEL